MSAVPPQGGFLGGLGGLFGAGGGLGAAGMTPEEQQELQRAALFQAGLATLASAQQPGGTLGGSLFSGFQAGAGALQQAQQNAFQSKRIKQQEEREARLEDQQNARIKLEQDAAADKARERGASVAQRVSTGIGNAKGRELEYFNVVRNTPEFADLSARYNLDPGSITTPEQVIQLQQQLGALGGVSASPLKADSTPAEIREFEYYQSLSPQEKATYLQVKRNSQPFQLTDSAGGQVLLNRVTGEIKQQTTAAEEGEGRGVRAAGETAGKTIGESRATAQLDLPRVENNANLAIKAIQELKASPGLPGIFGVRGSFPNFPGSDAADAEARLAQIKGKTFLEAFNSLKGGGAITQTEGDKATDAIARLQKAQSIEAAIEALNELEGVIARGLEVARKKAASAPSSTSAAPRADYSSLSDDEIRRQLGL